jgi:hypothetical protein
MMSRFGSIKAAIQKLEATARNGKKVKRETGNQVLALTNELNEVNKNLKTVFAQLR